MSIIIVKSVIYIYVYFLNNYLLTTDLVLFLGLILIINIYNFINSRISRNNFYYNMFQLTYIYY